MRPILILLSMTLLTAGAFAEQEQPYTLSPVSEETYRVLLKFLDHHEKLPLDPRITEKTEGETSIREKIVFRGVRGRLVPAYFEIPRDASGPFPVVLMLHGWSGSKENWWNDGGYISGGEVRKGLLEKGFAVFAIDSPAHGDRIAENDYAPVNHYAGPEAEGRTNAFTLQDIVIDTVREYRRGLDYLATRPEAAMDRIGLIGYSMGAWESFPLSAAEPRIKVIVSCVTPARDDPEDPIACQHYVRGIGDRPIALFMGREDPLHPIDHPQALYDLIPSPTRKLRLYDCGHKLPVEYAEEAVDWLVHHLN